MQSVGGSRSIPFFVGIIIGAILTHTIHVQFDTTSVGGEDELSARRTGCPRCGRCECPPCGNTDSQNETPSTAPEPCPECPACPACAAREACPKCPECKQEQERAVERKHRGESPVIHVTVPSQKGEFLAVSQPVIELHEGKLKFVPGIKRLAVDVGTSLYSPSSKRWLNKRHDLQVIAVEPNIYSHSLIAYTSHPTMAQNPKRFFMFAAECKIINGEVVGPTFIKYYQNCINASYRHLVDHRNRFMIVNAAASNKEGFAKFNMGVGDPGVGSLYEFKPGTEWTRPDKQKENWGHRFVPVIRLDSLFQYLPDGLQYEVLKIDAQGHDAEVLMGAGDYITRFKCVIGEFDTSAYSDADRKNFDYRAELKKRGFIGITKELWVNTRYAQAFKDNDYECSAFDVHPNHDSILAKLNL